MANTKPLQIIKENRELYLLPVIVLLGTLPQRIWNVPLWVSFVSVILLSFVGIYWVMPALTSKQRSLKTVGVAVLGTLAVCLCTFGIPALLQQFVAPGIALAISIFFLLQLVYWFVYWRKTQPGNRAAKIYPFATSPLVYCLVSATIAGCPIIFYYAFAFHILRNLQ